MLIYPLTGLIYWVFGEPILALNSFKLKYGGEIGVRIIGFGDVSPGKDLFQMTGATGSWPQRNSVA